MAEILQKAMTSGSFDTVFTEVQHQESINQSSHCQMRLFYLSSIEDRAFDTTGLVKLLRRNLGHYFFSRGEISQFEKDDDIPSIGLEAASELRNLDYSRIFEEIMICYLLEDRLNAPKLLSRPEIISMSGKHEGISDCIHILPLGETDTAIKFQMIFGSANVHIFVDIRNTFLLIKARGNYVLTEVCYSVETQVSRWKLQISSLTFLSYSFDKKHY